MTPVQPPRWGAQFERAAQSPMTWVRSARRLKLAAEAIWDLHKTELNKTGLNLERTGGLGLGPVCLLLAGLAIEGLAKAVIVQQQRPKIKDGRLPRWILGHRISALLRQANIKLDASEQQLVRRLEISVLWAGRYPVPKRAADMELGKAIWEQDPNLFGGLYTRLESIARR